MATEIPRLDPALQEEIDGLQTKHTELIDAIRGYSGGSVAQAANSLLLQHASQGRDTRMRESALLDSLKRGMKHEPSLLLDFKSETYLQGVGGLDQGYALEDLVKVGRSTPKWVMGPQGKLVEVPPNEPAYEYDPVTGECLGLLIEGEGGNLVDWSEDMSKLTTSGFSSVTPGARDGRRGGSLSRLVEKQDTEEEHHDTLYFFEVEDGNSYTIEFVWHPPEEEEDRHLSVHLTKVDGSPATVVLLADATLTGNVESYKEVQQTLLPNGSILFSGVTQPLSNPSPTAKLWIRANSSRSGKYIGDGVSYVFLGELSIQKGDVAGSSYIPTSGSPASRDTDNVFRELGDEINPGAPFTIYGEYAGGGSETQSVLYIRGPGGLSDSFRVGFPSNADRALWYTSEGYPSRAIPLSAFPGYTKGNPCRFALTCDGEYVTLAINGESVSDPMSGRQIPRFDRLQIGALAGTNNIIDAAVGNLTYYPYAMSKTDLQELTQNG